MLITNIFDKNLEEKAEADDKYEDENERSGESSEV